MTIGFAMVGPRSGAVSMVTDVERTIEARLSAVTGRDSHAKTLAQQYDVPLHDSCGMFRKPGVELPQLIVIDRQKPRAITAETACVMTAARQRDARVAVVIRCPWEIDADAAIDLVAHARVAKSVVGGEDVEFAIGVELGRLVTCWTGPIRHVEGRVGGARGRRGPGREGAAGLAEPLDLVAGILGRGAVYLSAACEVDTSTSTVSCGIEHGEGVVLRIGERSRDRWLLEVTGERGAVEVARRGASFQVRVTHGPDTGRQATMERTPTHVRAAGLLDALSCLEVSAGSRAPVVPFPVPLRLWMVHHAVELSSHAHGKQQPVAHIPDI